MESIVLNYELRLRILNGIYRKKRWTSYHRANIIHSFQLWQGAAYGFRLHRRESLFSLKSPAKNQLNGGAIAKFLLKLYIS
jgi:hypothetical protein